MKKIEMGVVIIVAIILLQTLYFKFTAAPESVWIFTTLRVEPWGRIASGVFELIAALLLLVPRTRVFGALLGLGIMGGALMSHLVFLGIEVQGDDGLLFSLALICFCGSAYVLFRHLDEVPKLLGFAVILMLPQVAVASTSYNTESGIGIHGYDPVAYLAENTAKEGRKDLSAKHDGVTYLFSSAENLEKFKKDPLSYIPAYGGWCAYAMADNEKVDIDPKTFKVIGGKTYLFYNGLWGNTLEKWNKNEAPLKKKADEYWQALVK